MTDTVPGGDRKPPEAAYIRDPEPGGFNNTICQDIHPITLLSQCLCMILVKMASPGVMGRGQQKDPWLIHMMSPQNRYF
jgi:hypothetical protein